MKKFEMEQLDRIKAQAKNSRLKETSDKFLEESIGSKYSYNFAWMGRPIIQYPQDMIAIQEIIWKVRPDLIIETGIAHGGSLILSASMLALLDLTDAIESGESINARGSGRKVIGIDLDIRAHNREAIESHPMSSRITMIEGSSIAPEVVAAVQVEAEKYSRVLVFLDSNHTHEHVLNELELYSPFVKSGGYLVVFDTVIEDLPPNLIVDRPWARGNNPKTAVRQFLKQCDRFTVDSDLDAKLLISVASEGYLHCDAD